MSTRKLILSAGLLAAVCAAASSQPAPTPPVSPRLDFAPPAPKVTPPSVVVPVAPPVVVPPPPPPPEKSVDDLINELERVQAQKAELEKKEQELKAMLLKKLEKQSERLKKLGVAPPAKGVKEPDVIGGRIIIEGSDHRIRPVPKEPDRVARIIIEGNVKTPDEKILKHLGFVPGQILKYPALEEARASLEKAGFRGATVEVIDDGNGSHFKDIRVRVKEGGPKPQPAPEPRSPSGRG